MHERRKYSIIVGKPQVLENHVSWIYVSILPFSLIDHGDHDDKLSHHLLRTYASVLNAKGCMHIFLSQHLSNFTDEDSEA